MTASKKAPVQPGGLFRNDNPVVDKQARQGQREIVMSRPVYGFVRGTRNVPPSAIQEPNERVSFDNLHHQFGRKRKWW